MNRDCSCVERSITTNTGKWGTRLFKKLNMSKVDWAWDHLLDFFFLCIFFAFFLPLEWHFEDPVVPSWLMLATRVRCLSLVWESSWDAASPGCDFLEWWLFLVLLPPCLDLELELPWALFLGECSPCALSCDDFSGRAASPGHSEICLFICWPNVATALRHVPHVKFMW